MKKTILVLALILSGSVYARDIVLRLGESVPGHQVSTYDVIYCAQGGPVPPPPPPPPRPVCKLPEAHSEMSSLQRNMDRLSRGKCGNYAIRRCGDNLEEHALSSTLEALNNQVSRIKTIIESECSVRACSRYEMERSLREFDDLLSYLEKSQVQYQDSRGTMRSVPMLPAARSYRPYCR